jgi:ribonuclease BN (tRNA processing enzyme)
MELHIWGPPSATHDLRTRLSHYLSPPFFPAQMRDLPCSLAFHDVTCGTFEVGGMQIKADFVCHPSPTVGYRITEDGFSLTYLPDHEPALGVRHFPSEPDWTSGFELAHGADLLIHDSQYSPAEYAERVGWGHSSVRHTAAFAATAEVDRLVMFHHDPAHDDLTVDRLADEARDALDHPFDLVPGAEGASFQVGR